MLRELLSRNSDVWFRAKQELQFMLGKHEWREILLSPESVGRIHLGDSITDSFMVTESLLPFKVVEKDRTTGRIDTGAGRVFKSGTIVFVQCPGGRGHS